MRLSLSYSKFVGLSLGFMMFTMFINYAIAFYYGSVIIENGYQNRIQGRPYTVGDVIVILFSIMIGGMSLGQAAPCLDNFQKGKIAGYKVFEIINRVPNIKNDSKGKIIENLKGRFEFKNVEFAYPAKKDVPVLKNVSFTIEAGSKTAIVGESGSGKSTCMQLLERFYDVDKGDLLLDDRNIQNLDLDWLRESIGYVGQEPVLFATSIRENLRFGKKDASEKEMWDSLEKAKAK